MLRLMEGAACKNTIPGLFLEMVAARKLPLEVHE